MEAWKRLVGEGAGGELADMRGPSLGEVGWSPAGCGGFVRGPRMSLPTEKVSDRRSAPVCK